MIIEKDHVVTLHFIVTDGEQTEIDNTYDDEPLDFIQGSGLLVQGLEDQLYGLKVGDKKVVALTAAQAYGERHEQLMQTMPISMFEGMSVEPGMQFRATTEDGEQSIIVLEVTEDNVVVDGNHPLAGIDLTFAVEVMAIREASEDELSHGHVHGDSCGHHH